MSKSEFTETSRYAESGVDSKGAEGALSGLLRHILPSRSYNERYPLAADIGYFANVIDIGAGQGIAFGTDGVGTKVLVAELMQKYDTIGIDCVAMNVNDVLCVGARPVSLVDYIACSFTDEDVFAQLGKGLAEGAWQAGVSISGGEISQIREIISGIDLIGACIGHVALDQINIGKNVRPGNLILGLAATGVHSNGLTLARKVLLGATWEEQKDAVNQFEDKLGRTVGEELLEPTRIYVKPVLDMLDAGIGLNAMVHITSGGYGNLNRVAAENIRFVIDAPPPALPVFQLIQDRGEVSDAEMHEVFNMGTGFCLLVEGTREAEDAAAIAREHEVDCRVIGQVEACHGKEVTVPALDLVCRGQKFQHQPVP